MDRPPVNLSFADQLALAYVLLFARAGTVLLALPAMLGVALPVQVRILLAALLSAALLPAARLAAAPAQGALGVALMVAPEIVLGLLISFATALAVGAVLMAGELIGNTMELQAGGLLRGVSQLSAAAQAPNVLSEALAALAGLVFFVAGFHRSLLLALGKSLSTIPLGAAALPGLHAVLAAAGSIFAICLELALPLLVPLFALALVQGVLARIAPQLNPLMAAPAAMTIAGLLLMLGYSYGLVTGIERVWEAMMDQALGWLNG